MKEPFDTMTKTSLEEYFVQYIVPEIRKFGLKYSRKTNTGLSPRENLGLAILSYFLGWLNERDVYRPAISNQTYDDGAISDIENSQFFPVEQVLVYEGKWDKNVISGIKNELKGKSRGEEYASGSILLVFCNAEGNLIVNLIKEDLKKSPFESVLIMGPSGEREFSYNILLAKEKGKIINSHFILLLDSNTGKYSCKPSQVINL